MKPPTPYVLATQIAAATSDAVEELGDVDRDSTVEQMNAVAAHISATAALAQVYATLAIADALAELDSVVRDLHETVRNGSRSGGA